MPPTVAADATDGDPGLAAATRRAAFDIGSGATKLMVADISGMHVEKVYFSQEVPVPFGIDWKKSADNTLSAEIMAEGMTVLRQFIDICEQHSVPPAARCAIATEVFRKASNGGEFLAQVKDALNLTIEMVSQDVEAELGFRTAAALGGGSVEELICWDSGGASFQITSRSSGGGPLRAYTGTWGTGVVTAALIEKIQGHAFSEKPTPNPVKAAEAAAIVSHIKQDLPAAAEWLSGKDVTAIGGPNSQFHIAWELLGVERYTLPDVQRALAEVVGKSDEEMALLPCCRGELREPPGLIVPKLCLLMSVMEHCSISSVTFRLCTGSCPGLLISDERYVQS